MARETSAGSYFGVWIRTLQNCQQNCCQQYCWRGADEVTGWAKLFRGLPRG